MKQIDMLYRQRFPEEVRQQRDDIWRVLCESFFQRYVGPGETVVDLGCGLGEFSRHIVAGRKIAVDLNPDAGALLPGDVEFHLSPVWNLGFIPSQTVDVCFVSNLFEHLESKAQLDLVLGEIHRVLRDGGRLVALHPNIKYAPGDYWDFYDHYLPLSHLSCEEAFIKTGFVVEELIGRFLPFTTRSALPQHPLLVSLYLRARPLWSLIGRQFLIVGRKPGSLSSVITANGQTSRFATTAPTEPASASPEHTPTGATAAGSALTVRPWSGRLQLIVFLLVSPMLFFVLSNIGAFLAGSVKAPIAPTQPGYLGRVIAFVGTVLVVALFATRLGGLVTGLPRRAAMGLGVAVVAGASFVIASVWSFDLDDKWINFRISRNVLATGLPLWNVEDMLNVNTSFISNYLFAPGHLVGDWETYTKVLGASLHLATGLIILARFGTGPLGLLTFGAVGLFFPALLWSLGALDTPIATFLVVAIILTYLNSPHRHSLRFWLGMGAMMWVRPEVILIGVGAFLSQVIRSPGDLRGHLSRGATFSLPIVSFLAINAYYFQRPMPATFYVKGWNKAFSGHYPVYVDIAVGLTHLSSALSTTVLATLVLTGGIVTLLRSLRLGDGWRSPIDARFPVHTDLTVGCLTFIAYQVVGGYQHMNFTFRYFVPGVICLIVVCGHLMQTYIWSQSPEDKTNDNRLMMWRMALSPGILAGLLAIQVFQSGLAAYHARHVDIALTISPLRDRFSIESYAEFVRVWRDAGDYLKGHVKPGERLFLQQAMAAGAYTDAYANDDWYAPPSMSGFDDIRRACATSTGAACLSQYDYILTFPEQTSRWSSHDEMKVFSNLAILRRRSDNARLPVAASVAAPSPAVAQAGDSPDAGPHPALGSVPRASVAANANSTFSDSTPENPVLGFLISPNDAAYNTMLLDDESGRFVRVQMTRAAPYVALNLAHPQDVPDDATVRGRAQVRGQTRGHFVLTVQDVPSAGAEPVGGVVSAEASTSWITLTSLATRVRHPDPRDHTSVALVNVEAGDYFDVRELALFVLDR